MKQYAQLGQNAIRAIKSYYDEVKLSEFPANEHMFALSDEVIQKLYGDK